MRTFYSSLVGLAAAATVACGGAETSDGGSNDCVGKCDSGGETTESLCVGIRGNGQRITAHFGAVARILEEYGLIDAVAGGSSGSITSFLLESVEANPTVYDCGGSLCAPQAAADRAALLFKSLEGYMDVLSATDEAIAIQNLAVLAQRIQAEGIDALLDQDPQAGVAALESVLTSPDLRDLVNPELLDLLATSPDPVYHARDIVDATASALSFAADDPTIFVRPGLISFPGFIAKVGRVGSFYAGYGPVDHARLGAFLDACAPYSPGVAWAEVAAVPVGDATCGSMFADLLVDYRAALLADEASYPSRLDDMIGAYMPALISTSVLADDAVAAFDSARADYLAARPVTLDVDFADVTFGYWGRAADLQRVGANPRGYADLKTAKFRSLGEATWRHALSFSPAEPGLARALELPDGLVSAGGWSDLQPVLVLKNLGCDRVVYATRRGGDSTFMVGVARMLGLDAQEESALLDLGNPISGFALSVSEADGVWCTNWDAPPALDIPAMVRDGYDAPLQTKDDMLSSYANASSDLGIAGCTPGVR